MRVALLLCSLSSLCLSAVASAQPALDKPAFTASPAELLALAKAVAGEPHAAIVLREDVAYTVDGAGWTRRSRRVVVVLANEGLGRQDLETSWIPSLHDLPRIQARVITPDGKAHSLDPKAVVEVPREAGTLSERRFLNSKLPNVVVGSVIEEVVEQVARRRRIDAGELVTWRIGDDDPVLSTRFSLTTPLGMRSKITTFAWPKDARLQRTTTKLQQTWRYTIGRVDPVTPEGLVPGEITQRPLIAISTAASWQAVARSYRKLVESRIAEGGIALPTDLRRPASVASVQAIVQWLHARLKPNDVSLRGSSHAPSSIADVLKRGSADAKDLATVLVALLRQAGVRADVALIATGPGRDVARQVPGIELFDRAIVRAQIGPRELWIDPVVELAKVGQLPSESQGRFALVIAEPTTGLVRTPKGSSAETVVRLTRTFEPSKQTDRGARVTEHNIHGGSFEDTIRNEWKQVAPARLKARFAAYAEETLGGTYESHRVTPPADLSRPFEITVVANDSAHATTAREAITVELRPADVFMYARVPEEPSRVHDLEWPVPHVYEVVHRIVLPPGYLAPTLPPDRTQQLGGATFAEQRRLDGKTLVITYRLDTGKARWTAKELRAYHAGLARIDDEIERVVIDHEAWSLANAGNYRLALAAVDALIKAYPKDGVHHQQRAFVLLQAGLGTAARTAAQRAIAVEPNHADMHVFAGWVLRHDRFGREWGPGYDRAGALAALARARKLDPKHTGAISEQAMVLERDPAGRAYEAGSDMPGAIAAWRDAYKLDPNAGYQLTLALAMTGRHAEAASIAAKLERTTEHDALHVATLAASASPTAAIAKLNTLATGATRAQLLAAVVAKLYWLRRYDLARALSPITGSTPIDQLRQQITRKPSLKLGPDPRMAAVMAIAFSYDRAPDPFWDRTTRAELMREELAIDPQTRASTALLTTGYLHDALQLINPGVAGRTRGPWRVQLDAFGTKATLYIALNRGVARVIGSPRASAGVARHALRLIAANDLAGAAQLLDWALADNTAWVSSFWASGNQDRVAIELAAAILAEGTAPAELPILAKCNSTLPDIRDRCDTAIATKLERENRWPELDAHVQQWLPRARPSKAFATYMEIIATAQLGRYEQADRLAAARLAADPGQESSIQAHARVAVLRGRVAEAVARLEPLLQRSPPDPRNLNNVAWFHIALGDHAKALELARKAVQTKPPDALHLGTLATAEAELGQLRDAKVHQLQAFDILRTEDAAGLYVFGRIAEQLALRDEAIALYKSVARKPHRVVTPYDFAQQRLKVLGAKP